MNRWSALEAAAHELGGYGRENIDQFIRGDFSCASPEDVAHLKSALASDDAACPCRPCGWPKCPCPERERPVVSSPVLSDQSTARYRIGMFRGEPCVIDTEPRIREVVAKCGTSRHAETVAAALNRTRPAGIDDAIRPWLVCNCADVPPTMPTCRPEHLPTCPLAAYEIVWKIEREAEAARAGSEGIAAAVLSAEAMTARLIRTVMGGVA